MRPHASQGLKSRHHFPVTIQPRCPISGILIPPGSQARVVAQDPKTDAQILIIIHKALLSPQAPRLFVKFESVEKFLAARGLIQITE